MMQTVEHHPLEPFIPDSARLLMLGAFPPKKEKWSMDFFYPNFINDMWRIMGSLFYDDPLYFVDCEQKRFKKEEIVRFATEKGLALYDTATAVRRLQDNASDKFLEVIIPTNLPHLLRQLPKCMAIVTTGQKATDILSETFQSETPTLGSYVALKHEDRCIRHYRMPSSSRAYPMKLEKKVDYYRRMMKEIGWL